jgi:hypothetical protein
MNPRRARMDAMSSAGAVFTEPQSNGGCGVVLDEELDRLGRGVVGDRGGEREGHVDAGGHAGGRDVLAIANDASAGGHGAEFGQPVDR